MNHLPTHLDLIVGIREQSNHRWAVDVLASTGELIVSQSFRDFNQAVSFQQAVIREVHGQGVGNARH